VEGRVAGAALLAVLAMPTMLGGCSPHTTQVHRQQLPELVRTFKEQGAVTLEVDGERAEVRAEHRPELQVKQKGKAQSTDALLAEVEVQGGALLLPLSEGAAVKSRVRLRDVEAVALDLGDYHPPGERLRWGVGLGAGGPSLLLAPFLDYRPAPWAGLELGGLGGPSAAWGFVGARAAPFALGVVRPFVGGFFQAILGWDANPDDSDDPSMADDDSTTITAAAARLGVDVKLLGGHAALRAEFDLIHPLRDRWAFDQDGSWIPFGGASLSYFP
jgi:hypothetical protein